MKVFTKILGPLTPPHKSLRSFLILFIDILVKNTYFRWNNTVHICSVTCDEICSLKMQEKFSKLAGNEVILPRTNFHAPATPPDLNNLLGSSPQMVEKMWTNASTNSLENYTEIPILCPICAQSGKISSKKCAKDNFVRKIHISLAKLLIPQNETKS